MKDDMRRPPRGPKAPAKPGASRQAPRRTPARQGEPRPERRPENFVSQSARRVALEVLLEVSLQDAYASLALSKHLQGPIFLSERDKRLVTELVYGTLENRIRLDYMIDCYLERTTIQDFERFLQSNHIAYAPGTVSGAYRVTQPGEMTARPEYRQGLFSIQSESSMLAARALCARPGQSLLDACAAPGGKTAVLAEAMHGTGRVYAWDLHEHRVALIRAAAQRLGLDNVRPMQRDASMLREDLIQTMDGVLLDAPCSGTGVMLSKPDIKYRQSAESVEALTQTQGRLLDTCSQYVRPGGLLVYSTCSILPEENAERVRAFLESHPAFRPAPLGELLPERLRPLEQDGMVQLLAHRDGMDGFFIARMRRVEE